MGTGTGWKALQQRRRKAMHEFDVEAQARVTCMAEVIPTAIKQFDFPDSFMIAMREAWEKWLIEPSSPRADLVVRMNIYGLEYCAVICREEEALRRAWKPYARVRVLSGPAHHGSRIVEITLL